MESTNTNVNSMNVDRCSGALTCWLASSLVKDQKLLLFLTFAKVKPISYHYQKRKRRRGLPSMVFVWHVLFREVQAME